MVQWLRFHASTAGGVGSTLGWGSSTCHMVRPEKKRKIMTLKSERDVHLRKKWGEMMKVLFQGLVE